MDIEGFLENNSSNYPINMFYDSESDAGKPALLGVPGLKQWFDPDLEEATEVRGMYVFKGYLYAVLNDTVYKLDTSAYSWTLTTTLDTSSGPVTMVDNGTQVFIVDGTSGYVLVDQWNPAAVTKVTDADFPTPLYATYQDGYGIVIEDDTQKIYISDSYDFSSWPGDFASAERSPDKLVAVISDHSELWLFGEKSIEVRYNRGDALFPFVNIQGAYMELGCAAGHSVAKLNDTLYWLSDKRQIMRASSYKPERISIPKIERDIELFSTISDAIGLTYTYKGHDFYTITFPSEQTTWVFDATTNLWHKRKSYRQYSENDGRFRGNCYAYFNGKHLFGDYENGKIYELDPNYYYDNGRTLASICYSPIITEPDNQKHFIVNEYLLDMKSGIANSDDTTPNIMLRHSDDNGRSWSQELWRDLGDYGERYKEISWKRLGRKRNLIFEHKITDPVEREIYGAKIDIKVCRF